MDESRRSGGPLPAKSSWENDDLPAGGLGATDVFGSMPGPSGGPISNSLAWNDQSPGNGLTGEAENPRQAQAWSDREVLREPTVHKVWLGGGSGTTPDRLLSLLSANKVSEPACGPAPPEPPLPSGPTALGPVAGRPPEAASSGSSEGFTQLLRALSGDSSWAATVERPELDQAFALKSVPVRVAPPSESTGGFTALLQGFSETGPDSHSNVVGRQPDPQPRYEDKTPASPAAFHAAPVPVTGGVTPVGFTQLLSALSPGTASPVAAGALAAHPEVASGPGKHRSASPPSGAAPSFTDLLSTLREVSHGTSTDDDGRPAALEDFLQDRPHVQQNASGADLLPASKSEPSTGNRCLSELIQTLEEPTRRPENPVAYSTGFPIQWPAAPVEPTLPAGPSEFQNILDMSKMREMQWLGTAAPAQPGPVAPSASAPVPPMSSDFQWPPKALPPSVPGQPTQFGGATQMPQYTLPAPVPQTPATPAAPAMGKMQQYLPLLLVIIIFLLVAVLVTVILTLKR